MRFRGIPILWTSLVLAACQGLPPQDFSAWPHASLAGSHVDTGGDRVDTFRITALNGWPVNRKAEQDPSRTLGVDLVNAIEPGRPVRVEFEGLARYRNSVRSLFWDPRRVEGSVDFVPAVDTRYVVRGEIGDDGSTVWLENDSTHEVIVRKFTAAPKAAIAPDMRTMTPDAGQ